MSIMDRDPIYSSLDIHYPIYAHMIFNVYIFVYKYRIIVAVDKQVDFMVGTYII